MIRESLREMRLVHWFAAAGTWLRVAICLGWALVLFTLLFAPIPGSIVPDPGGFGQIDKVYHLAFFAITELVCIFATVSIKNLKTRVLIATILALAVGAGTEVVQSFEPFRDGSVLDFAADSAGAAIGLAVGILLLRLRPVARSAGNQGHTNKSLGLPGLPRR